MPEQIADVKRRSSYSLSGPKTLRLFSAILVGLSFVLIQFLDVGQNGDSMEWKNGSKDEDVMAEITAFILTSEGYESPHHQHRDNGSEDCYMVVYPLCGKSISLGRVSKWKKRACLATGAAILLRAAI